MDRFYLFLYVFLPFLLLAAWGAFVWYQSSVQASVYRRQGVEMSTWEVLIGVKPVSRPLIIEGKP